MESTKKKGKWQKFLSDFRRDWQLHLLMLAPVVYTFIFKYLPMYGVQIAFRDYKPRKGITGSEWVGLKWFEKFLTSYNFQEIFSNTLILSIYSLIVNFVLAVTFALMINTLRNEKFKKFTQTITYIPHFISIVVVVCIVNQIFSPVTGLYGYFYRLFGGQGYPYDFRPMASAFRHIYVWSGVWQQLGWETIIYTAALAGVSYDLHEAAMIDGASRFQRVLHVDLPAILPTACTMLILKAGSIMTVGFEKVYLLQSDLNLTTSEVIATYVYKVGLGASTNFSFATAIGLFNSVIDCVLLLFVNWLTRKLSDKEVGLF